MPGPDFATMRKTPGKGRCRSIAGLREGAVARYVPPGPGGKPRRSPDRSESRPAAHWRGNVRTHPAGQTGSPAVERTGPAEYPRGERPARWTTPDWRAHFRSVQKTWRKGPDTWTPGFGCRPAACAALGRLQAPPPESRNPR